MEPGVFAWYSNFRLIFVRKLNIFYFANIQVCNSVPFFPRKNAEKSVDMGCHPIFLHESRKSGEKIPNRESRKSKVAGANHRFAES